MAYGYELISDLHKDARGFRPSADYMAWFDAMSDADRAAEWESLVETMERDMEEEKQYHAARLVAFNAHLESMMAQFGIDKPTALRWDMDANDVDITGALLAHGNASQEIEAYLWNQGIAFQEREPFMSIILKEYDLA